MSDEVAVNHIFRNVEDIARTPLCGVAEIDAVRGDFSWCVTDENIETGVWKEWVTDDELWCKQCISLMESGHTAPACADCPVGGRDRDGPTCPNVEACDRECHQQVAAHEADQRGDEVDPQQVAAASQIGEAIHVDREQANAEAEQRAMHDADPATGFSVCHVLFDRGDDRTACEYPTGKLSVTLYVTAAEYRHLRVSQPSPVWCETCVERIEHAHAKPEPVCPRCHGRGAGFGPVGCPLQCYEVIEPDGRWLAGYEFRKAEEAKGHPEYLDGFGPAASPAAGTKHDDGKLMWDLLQWRAVEEVVGIATYGARKYAPDNWRKVTPLRRRYISACFRHIRKWMSGEQVDPAHGRHHLAAAAWSLLSIVEHELGETTILDDTEPYNTGDNDDARGKDPS